MFTKMTEHEWSMDTMKQTQDYRSQNYDLKIRNLCQTYSVESLLIEKVNQQTSFPN